MVSGLALDSRAVKPGDLFFALAGSKTDGARFIDAAIAAGAVAVAGDHPPPGDIRVPFVTTPNPRRALALAAAKFYPRQPQTIAAVTGTSGKTSVAAFTRQIWQRLGHRIGQHRHHRPGVAEAHHLRIADHAGSDRAAPAARRNRRAKASPILRSRPRRTGSINTGSTACALPPAASPT